MIRSKLNPLLIAATFLLAQGLFADDTLTADIDSGAQTYSTALSERPFTLPAGVAEVGGKMRIATDGGALSLDTIHMGFGITNDFQLGISWGGMDIPGFNPARFVNVNVSSTLFANNWIASMASFGIPFHFVGEAVRNVTFSMPIVFPIFKGLSVITLNDYLVDFRFANQKYSAAFNLPAAVAVQITPNLAVDVSTRIARFEVGDKVSSTYLWDEMSLRLNALYAINNAFDIVANFGFEDVYKPKDSFSFAVGAQFRIGSLG